jgi:hypothetical protein
MKYISARSEGALERIAREMYNLESGKLVYGGESAASSTPADYPLLVVPPKTHTGLPLTFHYKPTAGVIFYIPTKDFNVYTMVHGIIKELDKLGYAHLAGRKVCEASPHAVMTVDIGADTFKPETLVRQTLPNKDDAGIMVTKMARLVQWSTITKTTENIPHTSSAAAFTWTILPFNSLMHLFVNRRNPITSMYACNTIVSSIFYDTVNAYKIAEGLVTNDVQMFSAPVFTPEQPLWMQIHKSFNYNSSIVVDRAFHPIYSNVGGALYYAEGMPNMNPNINISALPPVDDIKLRKATCFRCDLPLWGRCVVDKTPKAWCRFCINDKSAEWFRDNRDELVLYDTKKKPYEVHCPLINNILRLGSARYIAPGVYNAGEKYLLVCMTVNPNGSCMVLREVMLSGMPIIYAPKIVQLV